MLAALLPLIEALGAEGGAAGAFAGAGGMGSSLGRLLGGTQAFGSQAELGGALRQISDLQASIQAAHQAIESKQQQQEQVAQKAREDERQYAFSDPSHQRQMLELNRQQQAHRDDIQRQQRQLGDLQARAALSTDPRAAQAAGWSRAGTIASLGVGAAAAAPSLLGRLMDPFRARDVAGTFGRAGVTAGREVVGEPNASIIGSAAQWGKETAGIAGPGHQVQNALSYGPLGPAKTMAEFALQGAKLPGLIKQWGESLVESQRGISRFNGTLAMTFAESERRGVMRAIQSGQRTGGATADLNMSLQNLYDQLQPMKDTVTVVIAKGLTVGVNMLSEILKQLQSLKPFLDGLATKSLGMTEKQYKEFLDSFEKVRRAEQRKAGGPISRAFQDSSARDRTKRLGVPKR